MNFLPSAPPGSREAIREYYRTVRRFIEMELEGRGDHAFWRDLVDEGRVEELLELGAGTGRITRHLAAGGARVVAMDLSPEMLGRARDRLRDLPRVHFVLGDMRRFGLARRFGLVVAANDPFAHLPSGRDRDRALRTVAAHLALDGRFVLDAHWLPPAVRRVAATPEGWERRRTLGSGPDEVTVRERWFLNPDTDRFEARYEYRTGGKVRGRAGFQGRLWTLGEVRGRFARAGLRVRSIWADYDRRPWSDGEEGPRFLVEATRGPGAEGSNDPGGTP